MTKEPEGGVKAYKNLDFLNSPDARLVRVLSEYLEPSARFRHHNVVDTIVFFGSARVRAPEAVKKDIQELEQRSSESDSHPDRELGRLSAQLEMSRYYEDASTLARMLTSWSHTLEGSRRRFIVCTGGGGGIMEAACRGAREAGGTAIGLNISLPAEQEANPYISPELNFEFHYFFMRKFWFVYLAKALIIFPGGFGTLDELFEVMTLIQTRKLRKRVPVVVYGTDYWNEVLNFDALVKYGSIAPSDLELMHFCNTPQEAFDYLTKALAEYYL